MNTQHRILVVANPVSGAGRSNELLASLKKLGPGVASLAEATFAGSAAEWPVVHTTADGAWKIQVESYVKTQGFHTVLAIGGDGTLMEVAALLHSFNLPQACMIAIPGGRGNDFAKALYGYTREDGDFWAWAANQVSAGRKRWREQSIDLASANGRLFINMASIGYGGRVVENAHNRQAFWSKTSMVYQVEGALALLSSPECACEVKVDGNSVYRGPFFGAFVGNGKANGNGLYWTRQAQFDDGRIDGIVFPKPGVLEMARTMNAVKAKDPAPTDLPLKHKSFAGQEISFHFEVPVALELDGDFAGYALSHGFKCLPATLKTWVLKN